MRARTRLTLIPAFALIVAACGGGASPDRIFGSPTEPRTRQFLARIVAAGRL